MRYADGTYDDWELNKAKASLSPTRRTDEKLCELRTYYKRWFGELIDAGHVTNDAFARLMVVEDEMKARGLIEKGGTE